MSMTEGALIALFFLNMCCAIMIVLIKADMITLQKPERIKFIYGILTTLLIAFFIGLSLKALSSEQGQKWLESFSQNGDCDRADRPYWCDL